MPDEINPMADMGLVHDKQAIIEPQGLFTNRNAARDLCEHFIPKGGKFYDLVDRYWMVTTYVLNRDNHGKGSDTVRMVAPFLKAFGATDYDTVKFFRENMTLARGAGETARYMMNLMPVFMNTNMYRHGAEVLCDKMGIAGNFLNASSLDLNDDVCDMTRREARELREMAETVTSLRMPKDKYELDVPLELSSAETDMIVRLDDIFTNRLSGTAAGDMISNTVSVGANEKAYTLLDLRKTTQVDLDGTVYIGSSVMDYQVLDLVKDGNGLAMSFNGDEFSVHGANVAVIADDCIAAAVLSAQFYDSGIQGVFDLIDHWNPEYLRSYPFPDRNLLNSMLKRSGRKFPEVYRIDRDSVGGVAARSNAYRKRWVSGKIRTEQT